MSFLDKIASKVMPPESDEDRANARRVAEAATNGDDWLGIVLEQHRQIEAAFAQALSGNDANNRMASLKRLATVLTGHSQAEETVLYPAVVACGEKAHATMAYEEQAMTKVQLALLEKLDPMSQEWREKLEHIQGAVQHHVYEEEGTWFPELQQNLPTGERAMLTRRFVEEYEKYAGSQGTRPSLQMAAQDDFSRAEQSQGDTSLDGAADY